MPYILEEKRHKLDPAIDQLYQLLGELELDDFENDNNTQGNLNYIITRLLHKVYTQPLNYQSVNDVVGLLTCVKDEFYRTQAAPYENQKAHDNGDIKL